MGQRYRWLYCLALPLLIVGRCQVRGGFGLGSDVVGWPLVPFVLRFDLDTHGRVGLPVLVVGEALGSPVGIAFGAVSSLSLVVMRVVLLCCFHYLLVLHVLNLFVPGAFG
jgi:hypothetical protein